MLGIWRVMGEWRGCGGFDVEWRMEVVLVN
jgi:hypothetical protein